MRATSSYFFLSLLGIVLIGCGVEKPPAVVEAAQRIPDTVDFNLHVKPILSDKCFKCHGPDNNTRKANFRLDTEEGAYAALTQSTRKHALVKGNLRKSELFYRVTSDDPAYRMPPPASNLSATDEEVAILLRWIEQGGEYQRHWSLIPLAPYDPPAVRETAWLQNDIDAFILANLEEEDLSPNPEAAPETLLRRVTFDLTGLPPTLEELDSFLADSAPDAYEKAVDRLLASPAYGERMATEWLDVARYADSHGYQDDGMRNMWPWRDWVIGTFNRNMPFDEFVTWQLAGDMLPDPTREQILATGFNRNHLQSQEGGIVPEEYRVEYVADRTETFSTAFLGQTMKCSRCHDHKFDPLSQKDYFELFAFFNNVNEFGNIPYAGEASPTVILTDEAADQELAELRSQIASLETRLAPDHPDFDAGFQQWLASHETSTASPDVTPTGLIAHYPLDDEGDAYTFANRVDLPNPATLGGDQDQPPVTSTGQHGKAQALSGGSFIDMGKNIGYFERTDPFTIGLWVKVLRDSTAGPLFTKSGSLFNGLRGYLVMLEEDGTLAASLNHVFPDNAIEVHATTPVPTNTWTHLTMTYDGSSRAAGLNLYLNGKPLATEVRVDNLKKSILYTVDPFSKEETNWGGAGNLRLGWIGHNLSMLSDVAFDEMKVFDRCLTPLEVEAVYGPDDPIGPLLAKPHDQRTETEIASLRAFYVSRVAPGLSQDVATLAKLRSRENKVITAQPEVMVMKELPEPRATYLLFRGAYDAPAEEVFPDTPEAMLPFPENLPRNRLGLAKWLFDPANALPARVAVNRYWQLYFGQGLVATPGDFGNQGALPSHPRLLDWLAIKFVNSGWDVKALQKLIVLSATYRQSSRVPPALLEQDPDNLLLARGPSYRRPAEMIRDNVLAVSGLLVEQIGGPPVKPYQPEGLWKELATRNATVYEQDQGDKLYRRSMYTIWKRTSPPPSMINFDASERNFCTVQRQSTSTPLQALVMLNDPQFIEASRVLAERMIQEGGTTPQDRIAFAFRLLTSRQPEATEQDHLFSLFREEEKAYRSNPAEALALLSVGEAPRNTRLPAPEVAAYTVVANTIMNFDEVVIKR